MENVHKLGWPHPGHSKMEIYTKGISICRVFLDCSLQVIFSRNSLHLKVSSEKYEYDQQTNPINPVTKCATANDPIR